MEIKEGEGKTIKIVVVYKSVYGTTKQYAQWIAEALGAPLFEASAMKPAQLMEYDVVVYGGGLYAGGIIGAKLVAKHPSKALVVFTVGLATPGHTDYSDIIEKHFTEAQLEKVRVFHLHGGMDYGKLGKVHRAMMAMKKKEVEKIPEAARTSDDRELLETYGKKVDFTNKEDIEPLVAYVRGLAPAAGGGL